MISIIIFRFCTSILKRQKLCFCSFIFNTKHVKISLHNYLYPLLDVFIVRITGRLFLWAWLQNLNLIYTPTKPQVNLVTCSLGITKAYIIMRYNRRSKRDLFVQHSTQSMPLDTINLLMNVCLSTQFAQTAAQTLPIRHYSPCLNLTYRVDLV